MKELVQHLCRSNRDEIVAKSLLHCHAKGLHSIMLLDSPGKTIRLFVTDERHTLYRNVPDYSNQSIAFHAHHCDITLYCVKGVIKNVVAQFSEDPEYRNHRPIFTKYRYQSQIKDVELAFDPMCPIYLTGVREYYLEAREQMRMDASGIHTVYVPSGVVSAWFIFEGEEDSTYESVCYSRADPNKQDHSELYQPMSWDMIQYHLRKIDLL